MMSQAQNKTLQCDCCGTCCRKGGPTLQSEDLDLIAAGLLPFSALVTLRVGELAWDEAAGHVRPQKYEAIKLAGTGEVNFPWHCVFHRADGLCGIHTQRPAQCRALFCKDTSALLQVYAKGQISRADVLAKLAPYKDWAALAEAYEESCQVQDFVQLALQAQRQATATARKQAAEMLANKLSYDVAFRALCVEKGGVPQDALLFLLGRPLSAILEGTGLAAKALPDGWRIIPAGPCLYS